MRFIVSVSQDEDGDIRDAIRECLEGSAECGSL